MADRLSPGSTLNSVFETWRLVRDKGLETGCWALSLEWHDTGRLERSLSGRRFAWALLSNRSVWDSVGSQGGPCDPSTKVDARGTRAS
jgi:hypothetical protein